MSDFKLDFLCAGFNKCGTSSLHSVMRRMPELQLPLNKKETCYFAWSNKYPDPMDMFQKRYFPTALSGDRTKKLGAIEPSFTKRGKEVYQSFGGDVKLIFMLRNPADAAWSLFKMRLRRVQSPRYSSLYKQGGNDIQQMFRLYTEQYVSHGLDRDFFYDHWLSRYLEFFPKEQITYILFEDFICNYRKEMESLASFLDFRISELPDLPKRNSGDMISKDYRSAEINRLLYTISIKARRSGTNHEVFWNQKIGPKVQRYTLRPVQERLSEENRQLVRDVYRDSILRTAELTGLPLEERWLNA